MRIFHPLIVTALFLVGCNDAGEPYKGSAELCLVGHSLPPSPGSVVNSCTKRIKLNFSGGQIYSKDGSIYVEFEIDKAQQSKLKELLEANQNQFAALLRHGKLVSSFMIFGGDPAKIRMSFDQEQEAVVVINALRE